MTRVLITGANGLLGQKVTQLLSSYYEVLATARQPESYLAPGNFEYATLDITRYQQCKDLLNHFRPDIIVNTAGYTNVDGCEHEKEACWQANVKGVENLLHHARKYMSLFIHISTDYVFDGRHGPYSEEARPNPLGYYGKAKLASENVVRLAGVPFAILRTSVLFGTGQKVKQNFFLWVVNNLRQNKIIRVVTDQYNTPTLAEDLAFGIHQLIQHSRYGLYHVSGPDFMNRYDFATEIARQFQFDPELILPIKTEELQQPAPRPMRGGLVIRKAQQEFQYQPRTAREAILFLKERMETA